MVHIDQPSFLALEGMPKGAFGAASVTFIREADWVEAVSEGESVSEL